MYVGDHDVADSDSSLPFIAGRESEQTLLRQLLADAREGHGNLVLISGEAGIGKTALVENLVTQARVSEALILSGHCYDMTATPPFGPWVELFTDGALRGDIGALPAWLDDPTGTRAQAEHPLAPFEQVRDVLVGLTERQTLMLVFEDLHWSDATSLDLLRFVARTTHDRRLLIIGTYRDTDLESDAASGALLSVLIRETSPARIELRRLDTTAVRSLVASRFGLAVEEEYALTNYLIRYSEGNPLFLVEVLHGLEQDGILRRAGGSWLLRRAELRNMRVPVSSLVRHLIHRRLKPLDDEACRHLQVAATIGQEVPFELWSQLVGVSDERLIETLEQAQTAQVLEETRDGTRLRFRHALIREALYETLVLPQRHIWHRRIAQALLERANPNSDAVAYHLEQAGDARAADWWITAANRAWRARAALICADRLRRAVALLELDPSRSRDLGWCLTRIGDLELDLPGRQQRDYYAEALRIARSADDPLLEVTALWSRGAVQCYAARNGTAEMEDGLRIWRDLPAEVRETIPPGMSRGEFPAAGILAFWSSVFGEFGMAQHYAAEQLQADTARSSQGAFLIGFAHAALAHTHAAQGLPEDARNAFRQATEALISANNTWAAAVDAGVEFAVLFMPYYADRRDYGAQLVARIATLWADSAKRSSVLPDRFGLLLWLLLSGDWAKARQVAAPFARGDLIHCYTALQVLGYIARYQGEPDVAWSCVEKAIPDGPRSPVLSTPNRQTLPLQRLAADLAVDRGDLETAQEWIAAHDRWLGSGNGPNGRVQGRSLGQLLWARYHLARGDLVECRARAGDALRRATAPRQPLALLAAERFLGELDTTTEQFDVASEHLQATLSLAERCSAPYERATTLLALAEMQAKAGQRPEALLDEARAILTRLGAAPALARADALAEHLVHPSQPARPAGLTPREVEVLRLLAAGKSNREVASELYMSVRTAERHITNIYTKIDVHNRAEAIAFAHREGLVSG